MIFNDICILVLWTKVASALEGLNNPCHAEATFCTGTRLQNVWKISMPCHVGINWKALTGYYQMTNVPGFMFFLSFLA